MPFKSALLRESSCVPGSRSASFRGSKVIYTHGIITRKEGEPGNAAISAVHFPTSNFNLKI